jgi:hypothetical protein
MEENSFIDALSRNNSITTNGMPTNANSGDANLDLFFLIGATRKMSDNDIITIFSKAYEENPIYALRILFYSRDIASGLGERRAFRVIYTWLIKQKEGLNQILQETNIVENIIRVDDIVYIANEMVKSKDLFKDEIKITINFLLKMLNNEKFGGIVSKWMPRKNSKYSALVHYMRSNGFIKTYSEYRKMIVEKTNVVEQKMSAKNWDNINLEHVPGIALKKYKKTFAKHGLLKPFVEKVVAGEAKVHAKRLFPYDIVKEIFDKGGWNHQNIDPTNRQLLNEQWKALKDLDDLPQEYRAIPIIDVSGSMNNPNNLPISMATSLGLFLAERNPNVAFRNSFITFSSSPAFQQIIGHDIVEKISNMLRANWNMSTNLEAVFDLVLKKAVNNNVPNNEMPNLLLIISDMEFNKCINAPNDNALRMIKRMYNEHGYNIPTIVFWNVSGRINNMPVRKNDDHVLLISGASQNVINFIFKKGYEDMLSLVLKVINQERYSHINN